jgi:hypothetical protein
MLDFRNAGNTSILINFNNSDISRISGSNKYIWYKDTSNYYRADGVISTSSYLSSGMVQAGYYKTTTTNGNTTLSMPSQQGGIAFTNGSTNNVASQFAYFTNNGTSWFLPNTNITSNPYRFGFFTKFPVSEVQVNGTLTTTNLNVTNTIIFNNSVNTKIQGNVTCVIIRGVTSTLYVC